MKRYLKPLVVLAFVAMLATPAVIRQFDDRTLSDELTVELVDPAGPRARYGFRLTESARTAGITFVHEGPTLDPKLAHIMPQVASMGAAVAVVDVDADGHNDLYVTNSKEG